MSKARQSVRKSTSRAPQERYPRVVLPASSRSVHVYSGIGGLGISVLYGQYDILCMIRGMARAAAYSTLGTGTVVPKRAKQEFFGRM